MDKFLNLMIVTTFSLVLCCENMHLSYCKKIYYSNDFSISCNLYNATELSLNNLTTWVSCLSTTSKHIELIIHCWSRSYLTINKPIRVTNIKSIEIHGCKINGIFLLSSTSVKVTKLINSFVEYRISQVINSTGYSQYCFPSTSVEVYIVKNASNAKSIRDENPTDTHTQLTKQQRNAMIRSIKDREHYCQYEYLRYLEISNSATHFVEGEIGGMIYDRIFPQLQTLNLTMNGLKTLPVGLHINQWLKHFPVLKILDLSSNILHNIDFLQRNTPLHSDYLVKVNLMHNNIRFLNDEEFSTLESIFPNVIIDFRNNSGIECLCNQTNFKRSLKDLFMTNWGRNYSYLSDTCVECSKVVDEGRHHSVPMYAQVVFLCSLSILLTAVCVMLIKTRFTSTVTATKDSEPKISMKAASSTFDAFIAYSSRDERWVYDVLAKNLETNIPGIRLCLHHKHFVPGATIAENIINSVEESKHTLVILSKNFIQSEWCHMEFQTAFRMTLKRRRHLLIILLEDIDKSALNRDLAFCLKTYTFLNISELLFWTKLYKVFQHYEKSYF